MQSHKLPNTVVDFIIPNISMYNKLIMNVVNYICHKNINVVLVKIPVYRPAQLQEKIIIEISLHQLTAYEYTATASSEIRNNNNSSN